MRYQPLFAACALAAASSFMLAGCFSSSSNDSSDEVTREHDQRIAQNFYSVDTDGLPFDPAEGFEDADRWWGVLDGAGYRVEVPSNWNGVLVMYAHGYRGEGGTLTVSDPSIRPYLLDNGYAWAASSYSTNHYDVRAGVEDTNALALAFVDIAAENGRTLNAPERTYIIGHSMGGHVAGAAIEAEAQATANNWVEYHGAVPMCGVMGDMELFNYFTAYNLAAMELAGVGADSFPISPEEAAAKVAAYREALWVDYDDDVNDLTNEGERLKAILMNLSGGERPIYDIGFPNYQDLLQGYAGGDGTINGVLAENGVDTSGVRYRFESVRGEPLTAEEETFNANIFQALPEPGANGLRGDGLRWIPQVNGEFNIPVVTLHTLGDLFVPFSMQQLYAERAAENGNSEWLVQRAIRAPGHCDFTYAEQVGAFEDMVAWEQNGTRPEGDDILDPVVVADPDFGCEFTVNGADQPVRAFMPACTGDD